MHRRNRIFLFLLVMFLEIAPFLFANGLWRPDWGFSGFLANPIDGASYLAKMQEGWNGGWKFSLLYSALPSAGAYLFLFYISLGHIAHGLSLPLVLVFHGARILADLALLIALARFCDQLFPERAKTADAALWLASLGGGLGWSAMLLGQPPTADFVVAEAYPFLSMFVNPHFPLGLAILLTLATLDGRMFSFKRGLLLAALGFLLAIVQPFNLVIFALLSGCRFLWEWGRERRFAPWQTVCGLALGGPFLLYQYWAMRRDPILAGWNAQNITPAPALWDFGLSLSPALIFALFGLYAAWREGRTGAWAAVAGWLIIGCTLVYAPFSLQRRFMSGLYIPIACLCVYGMEWLLTHIKLKGLRSGVFTFSILGNVFFLLLMVFGVTAHAEDKPNAPAAGSSYLRKDLIEVLAWVRGNTPAGSVVLADAGNGVFVPAWSGRRTVYGHPFETPDAAAQQKAVAEFYAGKMTETRLKEFIQDNRINYIVWQGASPPQAGNAVFHAGEFQLIEVWP